MDENAKHPSWMHIDGVSYDEAYVKIFHTSKSIDEFKEKYLELQKNILLILTILIHRRKNCKKLQKKTKKLSNLYK